LPSSLPSQAEEFYGFFATASEQRFTTNRRTKIGSLMDKASIIQYILDTFDGVKLDDSTGDTFFSIDHKPPFATLVTKDHEHDNISKLNRPNVFRLKIGVSKRTYNSLFGPQRSGSGIRRAVDARRDFTALDRLLPHPEYGRWFWMCVLNPSDTTFEAVKQLLAEAYQLSVESTVPPNHKPRDITGSGSRLRVGDVVRIVGVPDLSTMAPEVRTESLPVFTFLVGKYKRISEFDEYGHVGIWFLIRKGRHKGRHWVALEPYLVRLRKSRRKVSGANKN
jgi:hypothetical protein